jgi:4-hydroxy-2-oxoheptanedioate aldolase
MRAPANPPTLDLRARPHAAAWSALCDPLAAEIVARSGVDLVVFDLQHGNVDEPDLLGLLQATQPFVPALVRLRSVDPAQVTRVLDLGADGVVVPMVDGPDAARAVVDAALYPPAGRRSYGPIRAALRHGPGYREGVAAHALVVAMIETRAGLEAVEAIAAVPGLGGLFVGPADLGLTMGWGPQTDGRHPEYLAARRRIVAAAHAHGLSVGLHGDDPDAARAAVADGVDWVVVASDARMLGAGTAARVRAVFPDRS